MWMGDWGGIKDLCLELRSEQERAVQDGVAAGACGGVRVQGVEHERGELVEGRDRAAQGRGGGGWGGDRGQQSTD
ncbi:uncharacterized protein MONOS_14186 [Monocercomonoides exilis]|uniref:uncharacterized protein n=1 Tax=Monocercomonoides exilis TaxID=2049356 RepID=UPI0035593B80|nr:hypothetical protein MONOS_14186 [Monocercomonoides exilis]|eukprot:MONOS_14186.1-p1 / transcript=MONOS_14186.1 / gene=MONOS_14186 / organism=Monocercomonoides_exilis_PA203 / gene_product=unspecified product / transcript_product=unspecified product / location=Mono_scaffold00952:3396-3729(-) / protein_length=75 / sequence_SO=supercontig / SO=protein_coding / is_pseudo=false